MSLVARFYTAEECRARALEHLGAANRAREQGALYEAAAQEDLCLLWDNRYAAGGWTSLTHDWRNFDKSLPNRSNGV